MAKSKKTKVLYCIKQPQFETISNNLLLFVTFCYFLKRPDLETVWVLGTLLNHICIRLKLVVYLIKVICRTVKSSSRLKIYDAQTLNFFLQALYLVVIITKSLTWVSWFLAMSFSKRARMKAPIYLAFLALSRHPCLKWSMLLKVR